MDKFHYVSTALLELDRSYQEIIEDITKRMGTGMAKFILNEVKTVGDYDEYCHHVAGLVGLGLDRLFHASGLEGLAPDTLTNSMGLFLQKTDIIRDYLEDLNEIRMFWPQEIWGKYANKLEDLKYEENSAKAVQCLNEMVCNALTHAEDCLQYISSLRNFYIFRFCAIPQIIAIASLALCYNNVEVFRGAVKKRRGLAARFIAQTRTMADVYGAFFEFSSLIKSKVDDNDPNATLTYMRIEAIQKACLSSGLLKKGGCHVYLGRKGYTPMLVIAGLILVLLVTLAALL